MTLLEDIQHSAIDGKSDLAELLRKCKLLAARLRSKPLEDWLIWESNGYPDNVTVPEYRIWPLETFGNFSGPGGVQTLPVHLTGLTLFSDDVKQQYDRYQCRESVATIESILNSNGLSKNVQINTAHVALEIGTKLYEDYNCVQAWAEYHPSRLVELLNSVRNRVLDFSLAVWKEAPNAGELGSNAASNPEPQRVTQIFNTLVYGGSANLVGTATKSPITFNIEPKHFSTLEQILAENGVSSDDITELKDALDYDPMPSTSESFGPKVSSWICKMIGKAAEGSWNIGVGTAGNLLAQVIAKYYGLL